MDQAVALWNVMFLSNGINELRGVLRSREMKFRQTGKRMKMTSVCSTSAADLAIAVVILEAGGPTRQI
jgi:hypothetical protein